MARFFIDRPVFAIVLSVFIVLGGLIAGFTLPIAQYPQINPPRVTVSTNYMGASSETVEQSIAQAIEQQVNGVEGMVDMRSTSDSAGQYNLSIIFDLARNGDMASVQTQSRVATATPNLPSEVINFGITTENEAADTVMYFAVFSPNGTYDNIFLKNYTSINLIDDIKRVNGIGSVGEYGPDFAMRIWLNPDKMSALGVSIDEVSNAVKTQNVQSPSGSIGKLPSLPDQQFEYPTQVKGRLSTPEEFSKIIVKTKPDGSILRLGDFARVETGAKDLSATGFINGKEAPIFALQLTPEANAMVTMKEVRKVLEEAKKRFPPDMELRVVADNTDFIQESVNAVVHTFIEALVLVLIIVFIFLQSWQATLIPMLAVPVSLIGTFAAFLILGFSINTLTLFAMVLAIGLVVDDAIVVVEAVEHHIRHSKMTPREATYQAMEEVSGPVVAIAFVLASVFIPVAFFGGTAGVLYKQFAITIAVSMGLSALVALTLTPALCTLLLKPHKEFDPNEKINWFTKHSSKLFQWFNHKFDNLTNKYINLVVLAIKKQKSSLAALLAVCAVAGLLFSITPTGFVPEEDQGFFLAAVQLPEGSSNVRTQAIGKQITEQVRNIQGVRDIIFVSGMDILSGSPKASSGLLVMGLDTWSKRTTPDTSVKSIIKKVAIIGSQMPEVILMPFNAPAISGASATGSLSMIVQNRSGLDISAMSEMSAAFLAEARKRPEIGTVYSTFRSDTPQYRFDVDRDKAEKLGVPTASVYGALQTYLGGAQINQFSRFGRTWSVYMQAEPQFRSDVSMLRFFSVPSKNGTMVPLNTLVKPVEIVGPATVTRFNGLRSFNIGGSQAPGYSTGQAMAALEDVAAKTLSKDYTYNWVDQSRDEKASSGRSAVIFGFAILFAFLCLAALYESWGVPFAVLLSVPTAIMGAILFQYLRGLQNNVYMQIGLVMLIGLAAKNAILIVEYAKMAVDDDGKTPVEAAIHAARLRLRPILMTSLAFIIGCLPLMMATGAGSGARTAMGTAVVGGMLMATCLGIFIIPVLYVWVEGIIQKMMTSLKKKSI